MLFLMFLICYSSYMIPPCRISRPKVFCKKMFFIISQISQESTCANLFLNKVADLRPATLLKKRLWHRCFPVNITKFLRTFFYRTPLDDCFCPCINPFVPNAPFLCPLKTVKFSDTFRG